MFKKINIKSKSINYLLLLYIYIYMYSIYTELHNCSSSNNYNNKKINIIYVVIGDRNDSSMISCYNKALQQQQQYII